MFRQPTFVASHFGSDAQSQAFFTKQGIPAVAAAIRPYGTFLREVDNVFLFFVTGPGYILVTGRKRRSDRMQARDKFCIAQNIPHRSAHAGHDPHIDGNVGRIAQFNSDLGDI